MSDLFTYYADAVYHQDLEKFIQLFASDIHVFDMWHWKYQNREQWRQMADNWFGSLGKEKVKVTFADIKVEHNGSLGYATAIARFAAVNEDGNETKYLNNRLSWVVQRREEGWVIVHEHTPGPADPSTLQVQLKH